MKRFLPFALAAAAFSLTACDEEKTADAKNKAAEAAKATGEAAKSVGALAKDALEKGAAKAGEKLEKAGEALQHLKDKAKEKGTPALEAFKARLTGFSDTVRGMKGQAGDNPAKAKEMFNQLMGKLSAISTDGVPADLAGPFKDYTTAMARIHKLTFSAPADPAAQEKWQMDHAAEMQQLEKDSTAALKALKDAAAKHGLTNLDLGE